MYHKIVHNLRHESGRHKTVCHTLNYILFCASLATLSQLISNSLSQQKINALQSATSTSIYMFIITHLINLIILHTLCNELKIANTIECQKFFCNIYLASFSNPMDNETPLQGTKKSAYYTKQGS